MPESDRVWREDALGAAVLAGHEGAWQVLYDATFAGSYAHVCWRCAGLRDLADEMMQECWLTAVRRVRYFDPKRASFAAWMRGIAGNVIRNHLRGRRRATPHQPLDGQEVARVPDERGTQERIASALALLSERHEAVLRAKYLEMQSVADIAAQRQESAKAIESLLTRAREAFREAYTQME
jgi:RNA polymerase sigma-70 factor, ECF subfamily